MRVVVCYLIVVVVVDLRGELMRVGTVVLVDVNESELQVAFRLIYGLRKEKKKRKRRKFNMPLLATTPAQHLHST